MELRINRIQNIKKKGMLSSAGTVEFKLQLQLILTNEEVALVETYYACLPAIHWKKNEENTKYFSVNDLIKGLEFKDSQIAGIIEIENHIRERMLTIQSFLKSARDFNGEKIIKFDLT